MAAQASLHFGGQQIGSITFDQPPVLAARRIGGGFAIDFPISVALEWQGGDAPRPLLTDVVARLMYQLPSGNVHHLGYAVCHEFFEGIPRSGMQPGVLVWTGALDTLAVLERAREDRPPRFHFDVYAQLSLLVTAKKGALPTEPRYRFGPNRVSRDIDVEYAPHIWARTLGELKVLDLVVVEIPLPATVPERFRPVWTEIGRARGALAQGGEAGWTACVVHVRRALEAWDKIEDEQVWPVKSEERRALSKRERLARLRWSLHQAAHPAAHVDDGKQSDMWSREEAKFMLSTLCSLLAMREP